MNLNNVFSNQEDIKQPNYKNEKNTSILISFISTSILTINTITVIIVVMFMCITIIIRNIKVMIHYYYNNHYYAF